MRYPPLLIALFVAMLFRPFTTAASAASTSFFLIIMFLAVIYAFRHIRTIAIVLTILAAITVTLRFAGVYWQRDDLEVLSHGTSFIIMLIVMIAMLSEVLRARTASTDLVIGAVCLYLVIGFAWTFFYYSIYLISPGSIFVSPGSSPFSAMNGEAKFTQVFYFSLAALTTIGSAGEEALTPMTRQLAVVESAMGQLYLAVLISRLVGFSTASDQNMQA